MSHSMQWKTNDRKFRKEQNARAKANRERKAAFAAANPTVAVFTGLTRAGHPAEGEIAVSEVASFVAGKRRARWQSLVVTMNGDVMAEFGSLVTV